MFEKIAPILTIMPTWLVRTLISLFVIPEVANFEHAVWHDIRHHVESIKEKHPNDSIFLTGHSLGGGIAQIMAAQLRVPSVVFSAPGTRYSDRRFNITVQAEKRTTVVVVPHFDVVPR